MSDSVHIRLAELLMDLEADLRTQALWSSVPPAPEAMASTEPFACDTLVFTQWLQFIFIPRLYALSESRAMLPEVCDVAPMAEEYFAVNRIHAPRIIEHLRRIDRLITHSR